jgi:hypothetical protein
MPGPPSSATATTGAPGSASSSQTISAARGSTLAPLTSASASAPAAGPRDAEADALALRPFDPALTDKAEVQKRVTQALAICYGPEPRPSWGGGGSTQAPSTEMRTLCTAATVAKLLLLRGIGDADADQEAAKKGFYVALAFDPVVVLPSGSTPAAGKAFAAAKKLRAPRIRWGAVRLDDAASKKSVETGLDALSPHMRGCYAVGLLDNPDLTGEAELSLVLDAEGRVSDALASGPLPDGGVLGCVKRHLLRATFAGPPTARVVKRVPLAFGPRG